MKVVFSLLLGSPPVTPIRPAVLKKTEEKLQVPEGRFKKIAKNRNYSFGIFSGREEFLRVRHNKIFLRGNRRGEASLQTLVISSFG